MGKNLLLVDDDLYLRNSISDYLISEGFCVVTVSNVNSALTQIKLQKPDLIIADIMMPDIDGYDFIKILRCIDNNLFDIPIIFLTAKGMTEDRIKGYNLGCNAYLTKPFVPNELVSIINNIFNNMNLLQVVSSNSNKESNDIKTTRQVNTDHLTNREITILKLVTKGYTNKEIASDLKVSIRNVEKYVGRLLNKTSTRNRTELAQLMSTKGIILFEGE